VLLNIKTNTHHQLLLNCFPKKSNAWADFKSQSRRVIQAVLENCCGIRWRHIYPYLQNKKIVFIFVLIIKKKQKNVVI